MILCLDSGNTRIKWGVHDGLAWCAQGAIGHDDVAELAGLQDQWPSLERVLLANVAGAAAGERIRQSLGAWGARLTEIRSERQRCGVTNLYENPERLGVDRWCALIGAWRLFRSPAIVVMAGTATTVDVLDSNGCFEGGLILPGIGLMLGALASGTSDLPLATGTYKTFPKRTDDAILTGILDAQCGAIERVFSRLARPGARCFISGGYANQLARHLAVPCQNAQNLPLEGVLAISLER